MCCTDTLDITAPTATLTANTVFGALRGLETFSQSVYVDAAASTPSSTAFLVDAVTISDFPRFHHRGVMIDTARHYLHLNVILENLDAMVRVCERACVSVSSIVCACV